MSFAGSSSGASSRPGSHLSRRRSRRQDVAPGEGERQRRLKVRDSRGSRRIASLGRGTVFGEMALIDGARRSATIVADEDVACYELSSDDFEVLLTNNPAGGDNPT